MLQLPIRRRSWQGSAHDSELKVWGVGGPPDSTPLITGRVDARRVPALGSARAEGDAPTELSPDRPTGEKDPVLRPPTPPIDRRAYPLISAIQQIPHSMPQALPAGLELGQWAVIRSGRERRISRQAL